MNSGEMLEIDPLELQFAFEVKKQISCSFRLLNKTDDYVSFKVKTTSPKKYCVRPNTGVVLPRSSCAVTVTMQAQKEAPQDLQCKDKFLVQSITVANGTAAKDVTPEMFTKESGNAVEEVKLRVVYVSPRRPPSPVAEESEERPSSPQRSVSDDGYSALDHDTVSALDENVEKTDAKPQDSSAEVSTLITKLQEEKNFAVSQNKRLRQELDLLKREMVKQQGGFSIFLVVIVALLGILLGYFIKA